MANYANNQKCFFNFVYVEMCMTMCAMCVCVFPTRYIRKSFVLSSLVSNNNSARGY